MSSDDFSSDTSTERSAADASNPEPAPVDDAPSPAPERPTARAAKARSPFENLLRDPILTRMIGAILKAKGIPQQDREDVQQEVLTELYAWSIKDEARDDPAELLRFARGIAKNISTKYWRKVAVHGKHNAGLIVETENFAARPNASAVDLIDMKKILAEIGDLVASGAISDKAAATLTALSEEVTYADHANETGQNAPTVRKTHERTKNKIVARLLERGLTDVGMQTLFRAGTAVAVAVAIYFVLTYSGHFGGVINPPIAHNPQTPPEVPTAVEPPALPPPTIEELARALAPPEDNREKAAHALLRAELAYKDYEWGDCVRRVSEAKKLDRAAGDAPELRDACQNEAQLDAEAKSPRRPPRKK